METQDGTVQRLPSVWAYAAYVLGFFFDFFFVFQLQGENSVASQVTHFRATFLFTVEMTIQELLALWLLVRRM